jgi:hypothetical protein
MSSEEIMSVPNHSQGGYSADVRRWRVQLPDGVSPTKARTRIADVPHVNGSPAD